jgi:uncharacterized protein
VSNNDDYKPIPFSAGIGLRHPHFKEILYNKPDIGWLEIHPENFFGDGQGLEYLEEISKIYPISFHCVGLSLGSYDSVSKEHLKKLRQLTNRFKPALISDHVSWSVSGNAHLNDLLPLPYNNESLGYISDNIKKTQEFLGRQILVENPTAYLRFKASTITEPDFLTSIVDNTGCKLLLDINNVYVNSQNHKFDPKKYIDLISANMIGEIHLAGHQRNKIDDSRSIIIDSHNNKVCDAVWQLYDYCIKRNGKFPTLIEWDDDIPDLRVLISEHDKANQHMKQLELEYAS